MYEKLGTVHLILVYQDARAHQKLSGNKIILIILKKKFAYDQLGCNNLCVN